MISHVTCTRGIAPGRRLSGPFQKVVSSCPRSQAPLRNTRHNPSSYRSKQSFEHMRSQAKLGTRRDGNPIQTLKWIT